MTRWAVIRSALIALVMVVGLLDGCPIPGAGDRPVMKKRMSPAMVDAVLEVDDMRRTLLRPFRRIGETARLRQRWKLFAGASRQRWRMRIEARSGPTAEWQLIYRVLDEEHAFLAGPIEYRRTRGAWNPHSVNGPRAGYPAFVRWVAGEVLAREPSFVEVRVLQERIEIGPRGGYRGTGQMLHGLSVKRSPLGQGGKEGRAK